MVVPEFDRASLLFFTASYSGWMPLGRASNGRLFHGKHNAKTSLAHRVLTPTVPSSSFGRRSSPFHRFGCFVGWSRN